MDSRRQTKQGIAGRLPAQNMQLASSPLFYGVKKYTALCRSLENPHQRNPARKQGACLAASGTPRVSEGTVFRTPPSIPAVHERRIGSPPGRHLLSTNSACCHGAPNGGDLDHPADGHSRRGCYKLSEPSSHVPDSSSPLPQRGHDSCERERPTVSNHGGNTLPARCLIRYRGGPHPADAAAESFDLWTAVSCAGQARGEEPRIGSGSA
jgi:hypothetical protein